MAFWRTAWSEPNVGAVFEVCGSRASEATETTRPAVLSMGVSLAEQPLAFRAVLHG